LQRKLLRTTKLKNSFLERVQAEKLDLSVDPDFPYNRDDTYSRFLIARNNNFDAAMQMLWDTTTWRLSTRPGDIKEEEVEKMLKNGEAYFGPPDLQGNEVVYIPAHLHLDWGSHREKEYQNFTLFLMEAGMKKCKDKEKLVQATMVVIMDQFSISNMDYNFCQFLFREFGLHYPECLSHILIVDSGWVFTACWSILKGWIDPRTSAKVAFITMADLLNYISKENLPKEYGGNHWKFVYKHL